MVNKANLWQSNYNWTMDNGTLVHIKNTSNETVVFTTRDNLTVNEGIFNHNESRQRWIKGVENSEGYFTLKSVYSQKVLTAISKDSLETKGIKRKWRIVYF